MAKVLNQNQRKWIEDNYDLIEKAVEDFAQDEEEREEIESLASLVLCESLVEGIDAAQDLRGIVRVLFQVAIPPILERRDRDRQREMLIDCWEDFERRQEYRRRSWRDYSVDWDGGDFSE